MSATPCPVCPNPAVHNLAMYYELAKKMRDDAIFKYGIFSEQAAAGRAAVALVESWMSR